MQFEYIPLLWIFFFPFLYKLWYWGTVFDAQDYGFLRSWEYLLSERGFPKIYHFWLFVEGPMFLFSFSIFYEPLFEIFIFNIMFYFLLLYNIFVFGKIFRWKFHFPKIKMMFLLTCIFIFSVGASLFLIHEKLIYVYIWGTMLLMPFYFLFIEGFKKIIVRLIQKEWKK